MKRETRKIFKAWRLALVLAAWSVGAAQAQLSAPTGFTASSSDGSVTLQWNDVPAATSYFLYRNLQTNTPTGTLTPTDTATPTPTGTLTPPVPLATIVEGAPLAYTDVQVTNGRSYLYQLGAFDASGLGSLASANALPFSVPAAVQPVTVSNLHSNALDLSWGIPLSSYPVSYYQIYRYAVLSPTPTFFATFTFTPTFTGVFTPPPTPTFTPSILLPATPVPAATLAATTPIATVTGTSFTDTTAGSLFTAGIYYLVVAVDGETPPVMGLAPAYSTNPALPQNLDPVSPVLSALVSATATPVIGTNGFGTRLFWNVPAASEGVTAYQVFSGNVTLATVPVPTYSYDDTTIPFSSSVAVATSYKVVALNQNGATGSNVVQVNILKSGVPGSVQVTPNATTNGVTVSWQGSTAGTYGLSGYRVYKSLNGVPVPVPASQPGSPTPTGTATPSPTPPPFATIVINPSATPTLSAADAGVTNANGWSYWVEPFDNLLLAGDIGAAATPSLNLAPTPVGTVTAVPTPGTNNQINVSWAAGGPGFYGPVQNYVIYREFASALTLTPVATVPAFQNNFTDQAVGASGTTVIYQVAAVDTMGNNSTLSGYSNGVVLSTQVAPGVPQVLPVSSNAASLQFSWKNNQAADNVDSYNIYGADYTTATPLATPLATVLPSPTMVSYGVPATLWSASAIYVQAHNSSGNGPAAVLSGIGVPLYHVTAVMVPSATATREVQVAWDMTPALGTSTPVINSFGVYRSTSPGVNFTPIASVTITSSNYVDTNLSAGQEYYYRVTARAGGGGLTSESPLYPTMVPLPEANILTWPNTPPGVTAVGSGVSQVTLSWTGNAAPESVLSYSILHNGTATATITPSPAMSINFNEAQGTVDSYQVVADNVQGPSDPSQPVSVLIPPAVTPTIGTTPPAGYVPTPGATPLHLVWISGLNSTAPVDGYTIYRSTVSGTAGFSEVGPLAAPASIFTDTTLFPGGANIGVTNFYKAAATGLGLQADPNLSAALAVEIWPNIPALSMSSSATAVTLSWATPLGNTSVTSYTVYRSLYPNVTPTAIATVLPPATAFPDPAVTPGVPYSYWLDAENSGGPSDFPTPQVIIPLLPPSLSITPLPGRNTLSWSQVTINPSNDVTGYAVFRAIPTPGGTPIFNPVSGVLRGLSNTTFTDSTVQDTVSYVYKVAAASLDGQYGAYSNQVAVTVLPQPITSVTAVSGDGIAQLRWIYQGTQNNTYSIQRKLGAEPDTAYQTIKTGVVGVNYLDTGLLDKTFYTYRIITVDSLGLTAVSSTAIALPAAPPILSNQVVSVAQGQNGNTLGWWPADTSASGAVTLYDLFNSTTMYPVGGYSVYRSTDGGAVYQALVGIVQAAVPGAAPNAVTFTDAVSLVGAPSYTYLVQAFDAPPDIPGFVSQNQAVTQGLVHSTSYNTVIAYALSASTALDRNAIRPFGAPGEQKVDIRFVVTQQGKVNIKVYSLNGTFVKELVNSDFAPGVYGLPGSTYPLSWDARNMNGTLVASGVYLITTEMAGGHQEFQKVAVIK